jgi:hypothetical protein
MTSGGCSDRSQRGQTRLNVPTASIRYVAINSNDLPAHLDSKLFVDLHIFSFPLIHENGELNGNSSEE